MNTISRLLTEDSVISFTDGTAVKGSEEVARLIIRCCREYNNGYMQGVTKTIVKGVVVGVMLAGLGIGISQIIKVKTLKNKEEKELD